MRPHAYVLAAHDLDHSARYFVDVLGFRPEWREGDHWQSQTRGEVRLMLGHCPGALRPGEFGDHSYFAYIVMEDVDALHAELVGKSAIIFHAPVDRPRGKREIGVATLDGHRFMFAQTSAPQ